MTSSVDVYLNGAQIGVEIVLLQMPSRAQNSWTLEMKQRKRGRDRNISERTEKKKRERERGEKKGICVKCILCIVTPIL